VPVCSQTPSDARHRTLVHAQRPLLRVPVLPVVLFPLSLEVLQLLLPLRGLLAPERLVIIPRMRPLGRSIVFLLRLLHLDLVLGVPRCFRIIPPGDAGLLPQPLLLELLLELRQAA